MSAAALPGESTTGHSHGPSTRVDQRAPPRPPQAQASSVLRLPAKRFGPARAVPPPQPSAAAAHSPAAAVLCARAAQHTLEEDLLGRVLNVLDDDGRAERIDDVGVIGVKDEAVLDLACAGSHARTVRAGSSKLRVCLLPTHPKIR